MAILECRELTKYFDSSLALDHVSPDLAALLRTMRLDKHFSIQPA